MAEFNPPRKWVLGRDLSYDCPELTELELKALKAWVLNSKVQK